MKHNVVCALRAVGFVVLGAVGQGALAEALTGIVMVELAGLKAVSGDVFVAVYDSDATWLGDDAVAVQKVVIADALDGDLVRTELQLPMGEYALSAFYDRDGDGELTTNFIGMPREPIGLSNNAVGKFGPPSYSDAVFTLGAEPIIQSIIMRDM
ncbi:MAG: DUF2141 domain-containing protein [Halioglobus sp.]|nr:DUF2141 domain-containing protein [Halioglobus sp.]